MGEVGGEGRVVWLREGRVCARRREAVELGRQVVELLLKAWEGVGNCGSFAVQRDKVSASGQNGQCHGLEMRCVRIIASLLQALLLAL